MLLRGDASHLPLCDAGVDAVVCDPPYADQLTMFGKTLGAVTTHDGYTAEENILDWTVGWSRELFRVLRPGGAAFVFSSARTFRFLASDVPPILLGLSSDADVTPLLSPAPYSGGLEIAGFTFHRLHSWVYGTGNPRGTRTKPAWEAIVEVRKGPTYPRRVLTPQLIPTLRALLPTLDAERQTIADGILGDPDYDPWRLWDHPAFRGMFDPLAPAPPIPERSQWPAGEDFYVPKPSVDEQNAGLDDLPRQTVKKFGPAKIKRHNTHPTPKPVKLMRTLVNLASPAGGTVLDPFAGSGSTGMACAYEGRAFIGVEREPEYLAIATRRIAYAQHLAGQVG
jgi:DNA modification methylase